ncbi:hypothetical protein SeMB42_g05067 [Synchytrium endobioticum]|uniref:Fatty acyl-CoA reductase n=1 Tax=Synchytrium endobioticum TaxID=286115 RepID=A0A507CQL7_9FUNG|nr:hypothetical protein SeLEV6574_g06084 [Synchytrium endobioticum]TPX42591.1 hypothetical protein SeMB42_g05067 [Synchytrium endobioticum]
MVPLKIVRARKLRSLPPLPAERMKRAAFLMTFLAAVSLHLELRDMEGSKIAEFFAGKSVFLTGATGFCGQAILSKLLRSCPQLDCAYILVRPKKGISPRDRVLKTLESPIFDEIRTSEKLESTIKRICCVSGDMMEPGLGLTREDRQLLIEKVNVIINSAAIVAWNRTLDVYIRMHIGGVARILDLARECHNVHALVHISTAYCHSEKSLIEEKVYESEVPPGDLLSALEWMTPQMWEKLKPSLLNGKANSYTWTKAVAESYIELHRGSIPTAIVRPSIVTSVWKDGCVGWVDGLQGLTGGIVGGGIGALRCMHGNGDNIADLIPVDVVANCVIAVCWRTARLCRSYSFEDAKMVLNGEKALDLSAPPGGEMMLKPTPMAAVELSAVSVKNFGPGNDKDSLAYRGRSEPRSSADSTETAVSPPHPLLVYNCTSGSFHPVTWTEFMQSHMRAASKKVTLKPRLRAPSFSIHKSATVNSVHEFFAHKMFAMAVDPFLVASGKGAMLHKAYKRWGQAKSDLGVMTQVNNPWDVQNMRALIADLGKGTKDSELFFVDVSDIDWMEYCLNYTLGVKRHLLKQRD